MHPRINKAAHEGLFEGNLDVLKEEINKLIKNQDQIEATRLIREKNNDFRLVNYFFANANTTVY